MPSDMLMPKCPVCGNEWYGMHFPVCHCRRNSDKNELYLNHSIIGEESVYIRLHIRTYIIEWFLARKACILYCDSKRQIPLPWLPFTISKKEIEDAIGKYLVLV